MVTFVPMVLARDHALMNVPAGKSAVPATATKPVPSNQAAATAGARLPTVLQITLVQTGLASSPAPMSAPMERRGVPEMDIKSVPNSLTAATAGVR